MVSENAGRSGPLLLRSFDDVEIEHLVEPGADGALLRVELTGKVRNTPRRLRVAPHDHKDAATRIRKLALGANVWVTVTDRAPTRSDAQNRLYWLYLGLVEEETGNDADYLHEFFANKSTSRKRLAGPIAACTRMTARRHGSGGRSSGAGNSKPRWTCIRLARRRQ